MSNVKKRISELRTEQYEYNIGLYPYLSDWKRNPYTFLKARFYMEMSSILVYFLMKTEVKPNTITIIYGLAGVIGGVLLAIPNRIAISIAIAIFFMKGILDWSDGHLARLRDETSFTGHVLDHYGAYLNLLGFQIGLGFYVANKADTMYFYYLIPLIPFFHAAAATNYCYKMLYENILERSDVTGVKKVSSRINDIRGKYGRCFKAIEGIFDDRARSVDLILILIIFEMIFPPFFITWIVFLVILFKEFIIFIGKYYLVAKKRWAENTINSYLDV